jgi:hypothetical protein
MLRYPVQSAAKAGSPIGRSEEGEIGFAEPGLQRLVGTDLVQKTFVCVNEHGSGWVGKAASE